ncbi:T4-like phage head completion, neckhetero-dimeric protein [Stenotrophomonas phage IME13]|uniref:T4-like phage head completion, neckhetero-dimeric protein n=1 Tax=Stenotrophomonas phage IME13 TaxID=1211280 RepID=J7HY13_9CAUD|nr:head-tail adaptor Ad2 [Stenotrophomonas phage IME13]AFQ22637.1 T4-like phage head completion, neckhetero-dimeric protein [Stenotrophomonas phage IME13]
MSYTTNNPLELKDAILRRLGAPIVHVEVTEQQVFDCISRALELYGEYHYDGFHKTYATVVLTEEQAKTGVISFAGGNVFCSYSGNSNQYWVNYNHGRHGCLSVVY